MATALVPVTFVWPYIATRCALQGSWDSWKSQFPMRLANTPLDVLAPRHIPQMPVAIQQGVLALVKLYRDNRATERSKIMVAFCCSARKHG